MPRSGKKYKKEDFNVVVEELKGNNIISSLDVKLLKGNINGITKFKLFIPETLSLIHI